MSESGRLQINLLGEPEVWLDGARLSRFSTAKTEALLYYLAATRQVHSRDVLAGLLWAEMPDAKARRNLTKSLSVLRRLLGPFLLIETQRVGFHPQAAFDLDLDELEAASVSISRATLTQIVARIRGEFLSGFYVRDAPAFEAWMLAQREDLRQKTLALLEQLAAAALAHEAYEEGIGYARRLLALDPWRESAHRHLMALLANSGRRSDALAQYEQLRDSLKEEMGVQPMPETRMLYDRLLRLETPVPHNLPAATGLFVGRAGECARLIATLNDPACRLLTLSGPGGIGKTRLALQAARHFAAAAQGLGDADFSDGVYFVDLAAVYLEPDSVRTEQIASQLATAIVEALQIPLRSTQKPLQQLFAYLAGKRMLVIIDNFEEWLPGARYLGDLLRHAAQVKLLVTSRERLNLRQEWVVEIEGLPFPRRLTEAQIERLAASWQGAEHGEQMPAMEAVTLFVHHARRVHAAYKPTGKELDAILHICRLVEGSPLALELAASWLRVLSGEEIVVEIQRSIDFLAANTRDLPPRHRSMRAVFDHSWQMLTRSEQAVLAQLSVFRGSFDRASAQKVARASLPVLASLIDKSWLQAAASGRYRLHELVRKYTTEKLVQDFEEMIAARDRHSHTYATFVEQHIAGLYSSALPEAIAALAIEIADIRAGWRWAAAAEYAGVHADIGHYVRALRIFYGRRGLFHEGLQMCETFIERIGQEQGQRFVGLMGQLTLWKGLFHHYLGDLAAASDCFRRSLQRLPALAADAPYAVKDLAGAYHLLGMVERRRGHYKVAQQAFVEAERLDASLGDRGYAAKSAAFVGIVDLELGHFESARRRLEACLPMLRENRDFYYSSMALGALSQVYFELGLPLGEVIHLLRQNLKDGRALNSEFAEAATLAHLGAALHLSGAEALVEAREHLEESLAQYERIQTPLDQLQVHLWLAATYLALGQTAAAEEKYRVCIEAGYRYGLLPLVIDGAVGLVKAWREMELPVLTLEAGTILAVANEHQATTARTRSLVERLSQDLAPETAARRTASLAQIVSQIVDVSQAEQTGPRQLQNSVTDSSTSTNI